MSRGVAEAQAVLAASSSPIFLMDAGATDADERNYAIGWNSVWASDANRERLTDVIVDPKPHAGQDTRIRAFRERSGAELGRDHMTIGFRHDRI